MNWTALKLTLEFVSALAALANALDAAPLKAVIKIPATAIAGDDVVIDTSGSTGDILRRHLTVTPTKDGRELVDTSQSDVSPRLRSYAGTYAVELMVIDKEGFFDKAAATITITADVVPLPCPPCPDPKPIPPKPTPEPTPNPTPPAPIPPGPPPLPIPNADGKFKVGNKVAKIVQDVYRAKIAGQPADKHLTIYNEWASEVAGAAATAETIAAQIAAGTLSSITQVKVDLPKSSGWGVATAALSQLVLETYKANSGTLKLSLAGGISAADEWAELLREIGNGVKAAK